MVADASALPEMQALLRMLIGWGEEILNYFTTRVTQGIVAGKNHRAKVIQRQAYGYRNFANYRLRRLLASRSSPVQVLSPESALSHPLEPSDAGHAGMLRSTVGVVDQPGRSLSALHGGDCQRPVNRAR